MQHRIERAFALGGTIRAARKVRKSRQTEAAGRAGGPCAATAGRGANRETPHD
ncbi:hypothetical protein [Burkholderia stabilis]|uniref:hypothetical protein n=1 Tax=Burkholderia stabilis TaxID=95485 RepID=UPI0012E9DEBB|nr:hypothetical protein [Burkholderia stabilis]HDR9490117.1 hypothetical protein [Burkholderia stabilis]HDR9521671.1 hypothetical protein [Burkholderia stabilis]HDR9537222.1 hypothetical protein [Burkholderia stabilis]HDR9575168.1 hypothetical protein [Burkholderia stabilis]HDR9624343.1 hypothetical protein [Burkholderia stabilis]